MIDLKITKERLKNHMHYSKWLYVLVLAVVLVIFNLSYTMSEPEVPTEFKVSILVNDYIFGEEGTDKLESELLEMLPEDQQEVKVFSLSAGGGGGQDLQIVQVLMARLVAKQDDILILPYETFKSFAHQGSFVPLDEKLTIPSQPEDVDMSEYTIEILDDDGNGDGQPMLYGIPLDGSAGLQNYGIMNEGLVAGIPVTSGTVDNAVLSLQYLLNQTQVDEGK